VPNSVMSCVTGQVGDNPAGRLDAGFHILCVLLRETGVPASTLVGSVHQSLEGLPSEETKRTLRTRLAAAESMSDIETALRHVLGLKAKDADGEAVTASLSRGLDESARAVAENRILSGYHSHQFIS